VNAETDWWESYHGKLRAAHPDETLLFVGARGIIRDDAGRYLMIKRTDNGHWSFPAGGMELGESLDECVIREVWEETGLKAGLATPFAFYSGAQHTYTNVFGHTYQHLSMSYLLTDVTGELAFDPNEASEGGFYSVGERPELSPFHLMVLDDLAAWELTGRLQTR
jgi:8-oxo-dGTP pyrophosphatase MutT (NUDIX family)